MIYKSFSLYNAMWNGILIYIMYVYADQQQISTFSHVNCLHRRTKVNEENPFICVIYNYI